MSASSALRVKSLGVFYASLFVFVQKLLEDKLINAAVQKNKIKKEHNNFIKWHIGHRRQCFWKHMYFHANGKHLRKLFRRQNCN